MNHEALLLAKLNRAFIDGVPCKSSGSPVAPGVVRRKVQPAKRQRLLLAVDFHDANIDLTGLRGYGVFTPCAATLGAGGAWFSFNQNNLIPAASSRNSGGVEGLTRYALAPSR